MDKDIDRPLHQAQEEQGAPLDPASGKQPWQEPRLTFIEPTLTKHGTLEEVTGMAFFSWILSLKKLRLWPCIPSRN